MSALTLINLAQSFSMHCDILENVCDKLGALCAIYAFAASIVLCMRGLLQLSS